mmetsp:Transcript_32430/g.74108  ORF Transcript_32430/g.74108 Transcript_32430/m.74108 type:complete len:137 (-) Transcript_32430:81-491(-)
MPGPQRLDLGVTSRPGTNGSAQGERAWTQGKAQGPKKVVSSKPRWADVEIESLHSDDEQEVHKTLSKPVVASQQRDWWTAKYAVNTAKASTPVGETRRLRGQKLSGGVSALVPEQSEARAAPAESRVRRGKMGPRF